MLTIMLGLLALATGSYIFSFWLEDSKPKLFTATVWGRVAGVAFEQPAIFTILAIHTVLIPFVIFLDYLKKGEVTYDAWLFYLDVLGDTRNYYLRWVPTFVTTGVMLTD